MQHDEKMLRAAAEKAKEQSTILTQWAQQEFKLPPEYQIRAKVTLSIKRVRQAKSTVSFSGLVFDQQPTSENWSKLISLVEKLSKNAKCYKRSKGMWRDMASELKSLRKSRNVAYVRNATRLNLYFQQHGIPNRLLRVDGPGDETLYSLLTAKPILTPTP